MDNAREKLVELLDNAEEWATEKCDEMDCDECPADKTLCNCMDYLVADFLIANGVTIQKWIPVSERLPENDQYALCLFTDGSYHVFQWNYIDWMWNDGCEWWQEKDVTHWMPLPEPPKGE